MKSEHRHELKTNELRRLTAKAGEFFEEYGNRILWTLCIVLLIAAPIIYWVRSSTSTSAAGWSLMARANSAEGFAEVADRYSGTPVAAWARLREAEQYLEDGIRQTFTDRGAAVQELTQARKSFDTLLGMRPLPRDVHERGLFGLARCLETLAGVKLKDEDLAATPADAVRAYENLVSQFPGSMYEDVAKQRIEVLNTGGAQEFYAWFSRQNPKPPDPPAPRDGLPADHPPFDLPGDTSSSKSSDTTPGDSETPAGPSLGGPEKPASTPSGSPPAPPLPDDSRAEPKPGEKSEKPQAEKPAAAKPRAESPEGEESDIKAPDAEKNKSPESAAGQGNEQS